MGWESSDVSDLNFGPSFKVKRWFTGCGELSFWWIHICISSPMRRSSYLVGPTFARYRSITVFEINDIFNLSKFKIAVEILKSHNS